MSQAQGDERPEAMEVADSEGGIVVPPLSPSVEMASESNEPQTSPNVVDMPEEPELAVEMTDVTEKSPSPDDLGELKSPSPTVEMLDANKSPTMPVVEMKEDESLALGENSSLASESEENVLFKNSMPISPGTNSVANVTDILRSSEDMGANQSKDDSFSSLDKDDKTDDLDNTDGVISDALETSLSGSKHSKINDEKSMPVYSNKEEGVLSNIDVSTSSLLKQPLVVSESDKSVLDKLGECESETRCEDSKNEEVEDTVTSKDSNVTHLDSDASTEHLGSPSNIPDLVTIENDSQKVHDDNSDCSIPGESEGKSEILEKPCLSNLESQKTAKDNFDNPKSPINTSESSSERPKSTEIMDDPKSPDDVNDLDHLDEDDDDLECDDDTQESGSKDLTEVNAVEGVTVPGGADGEVGVEEESGDDPLGATEHLPDLEAQSQDKACEPMEEEILGADGSRSTLEDTILMDGNKSLTAGSAEGDEILPDTDKSKVVQDKSKELPEEGGGADQSKETVESSKDAPTQVEVRSSSPEIITISEKTAQIKKNPPAKETIETKSDKDCEIMEVADTEESTAFKESEVDPVEELCHQCNTLKDCHYKVKSKIDSSTELFFCSKLCFKQHLENNSAKTTKPSGITLANVLRDIPPEAPMEVEEAELATPVFKRQCSQCSSEINNQEETLAWETMEFCTDSCLGIYQKKLGSFCANCKGAVLSVSLGKYCVRFGINIRQFCTSSCLEEFKKGLKACSYCQKDISSDIEGFLAPIGDKGQFKDFCSRSCMQSYDVMSSNKTKSTKTGVCAVCCEEKDVAAEMILDENNTQGLCSNPCLAAYKFANNLTTEMCEMCKKHYNVRKQEHQSVYYNDKVYHFCSKTCLNVHTLANRKIVACHWCKVKKYNFDMIRKSLRMRQDIMVCSLNCMALYQVSASAVSSGLNNCDHCKKKTQGQFHLTMSDATIRNFCTYTCCMQFQSQFSNSPLLKPGNTPIPTGLPKRTLITPGQKDINGDGGPLKPGTSPLPVITNVKSLAKPQDITKNTAPVSVAAPPPPTQIKVLQQTIIRPALPKKSVNKKTQCRPNSCNKSVSCKPIMASKSSQTDDAAPTKILLPVPVPFYIPVPMHMFSAPFPVPVPFPLPIPVPIFIPTTRNTTRGIRKEIKRIQEQIPRDPFEAELLMMAEMVAEDKKGAETSSDSDNEGGVSEMGQDNASPSPDPEPSASAGSAVGGEDEVEFSPEEEDATPTFGDDMLQIALKMATELTEPSTTTAIDLETALTPATPVIAPPPPTQHSVPEEDTKVETRGVRKRSRGRPSEAWTSPAAPTQASNKRPRTNSMEASNTQQVVRANIGSPAPVDPPDPAVEQDPNLSLKFTYGVLAFRKWLRHKNSELAAKPGRGSKPFSTDILQLSTDELNFALCMFVKEVRKPDGEEYAPDIIYYLCLGIQQYLFRSGRIDNIFTDAYYDKFTECLGEIALKFTAQLHDRRLVTRVEEEHLWESKQLGAHSPHVLLSTLMFFNTKHFLLTEVEDHMRLSFTHVMKHWKRNHAQPGKTGATRNVLLRYYPPQAVLDADERKKKVYEQQENEQNPLRCPVKLYEFYVSKCPESVRGRNDVFYLLPERSCVPDSPVWYSTMALPRESISKMLNRIRMVREVLSLLHSLDY